MNHAGEYHLIGSARLEELEKQGWTLVGYVRRIGYAGVHIDNVLVHRPAPPPPPSVPR